MFIAFYIWNSQLSSNFKLCKKSDPKVLECLRNASRDAVISMADDKYALFFIRHTDTHAQNEILRIGKTLRIYVMQRLKSFKILPIESLAINSVKIGESQDSMIDWDNLKLSFVSFNPQVDFIADYKLEGRILLMPIQGEGRCNLTLYNLTSKQEIHFKKFQKDGETYMQAVNYFIKFIPEHITLHFDNLFNGNTFLGEEMNRFINMNSDLIFKEFQTSFEETFGLIFIKITNDIFNRVPMNKIFL
ncbi:hypothetical protein ACFW04_006673 [Cataglyphis niger]